MKKILTMMLALAMLLGCVASFASCGLFNPKPKLNLEKAADALEDEDYMVSYSDEVEDDTPYIKERLYAVNGDDSITMIKFADAKSAKLYYKEVKLANKQEIEEYELRLKFMKNILKKYEDDMSSAEIDDLEDEIKDIEDEIEDLEEASKYFGRSGKIVWVGTKGAIKDAK